MYLRVLVIANPDSGTARYGQLEAALDKYAGSTERRVRILHRGDDVTEVAREELKSPWDVVVAAGGDGTVAGVAQAAGEAGVPVLVAPMGTANMLAVQLDLPTTIEGAIKLLGEDSVVREIDGMEIDGRLHLLSVGVGVSAATIRNLGDAGKHRYGFAAYLWTGIGSGFSFRPTPCRVAIDGRGRRLRILDVSVLNAGFKAERRVLGIPDIRPDDGRLDVLVVWAPRPAEYIRHLVRALFRWRRVRPNVEWLTAERDVVIDSEEPLPVQSDGDIIGETPVTIRVVGRAVGVVAPAERAG